MLAAEEARAAGGARRRGAPSSAAPTCGSTVTALAADRDCQAGDGSVLWDIWPN